METEPTTRSRLLWCGGAITVIVLLGAFAAFVTVGAFTGLPQARDAALAAAAAAPLASVEQAPPGFVVDRAGYEPLGDQPRTRTWVVADRLWMVRVDRRSWRVMTGVGALNDAGRVRLCRGNCAAEIVRIVRKRMQERSIDPREAERVLASLHLI